MIRSTLSFLASKGLVVQKHNNIAIAKLRESICRKCPKFNEKLIWCKACGCMLDVKWESLVNKKISTGEKQLTHCIEGRWNDQEIANYYKQKSKS